MSHVLRRLGLCFVVTVLGCSGATSPVDAPGAHAVAEGEPPTFAAMRSSAILAAAMTYPVKKIAEEPPLSLTASDGTGLTLSNLEARAVVEGPLAFTELRLRFDNPQDRVIEGRFAITLPPGATVSRLAMRSPEGWQEAEVVEKQLARAAYEDALHRKQDPALLEKEAGNEFRARIFPIPARASKDIIVSYSQEIPAGERYRLPLRGLPEVGRVQVTAMVGKDRSVFDRAAYRPDRDFEVAAPALSNGLRYDDVVLVPVRPDLGAERAPMTDVVILFDTSASRALGFAREVERLGQLVALLAKGGADGARLTVATFDQTIDPVYEGPIAGFSKRELGAILARRPLGASDLAGAIAWLGRSNKGARAVLMTDGVATTGGADEAVAAAKALRGKVDRLDVVLSGGIRDEDTSKRLVRGVLDKDGVVLDGGRDVAETARRLALATRSGISVEVAGAAWSWPERLDGVQPGDETFVYALLKKGTVAPNGKIAVTLAGGVQQKVDVPLAGAQKPLLERAAANAEIARLTAMRDALPAKETAKRDGYQQQIIKISTTFRVLSDFTSLLVLESDRDYARFGIDRRALADILVVGDRGVELTHRTTPVVLVTEPPPPPPKKPGWKGPPPPPKLARAPVAKKYDEAEKKKPEKGEGGAVAGNTRGGAILEDRDGVPDTGATTIARPAKEEPAAPRGAPTAAASAAPAAPRTTTAEAPYPSPGVPVAGGRLQGQPPALSPPPRPTPAYRPPAGAAPPAEARPFALEQEAEEDDQKGPAPYSGKMADVMDRITSGKPEAAVVDALHWQIEDPGDVLALVALGEALEASGAKGLAGRAYGSILDLFPGRADMRRFAAERLERLGGPVAKLATDAYAKAAADRPDHLNGHRLYAYALLRDGRVADAFAEIESGLSRQYPPGRFLGGDRILLDDLGLVGAAWVRVDPKRRDEVEKRLAKFGGKLATTPSLRFVLYWETDANDVDFHIRDAKKGHAFYRHKDLPSGGELYADVTTGYGPECFTIEGTPQAYPYRLQIHYYSRGPMGYGMGKLEIVEHDGKGGLKFEQRPFVVMNDHAFVDLGPVNGPLGR